jgi:hypothetical protein
MAITNVTITARSWLLPLNIGGRRDWRMVWDIGGAADAFTFLELILVDDLAGHLSATEQAVSY